MRGVFTFCTLAGTILFPWPLTVVLVLGMAFLEPLLPLAAGIIFDSLYFTSPAQTLPIATLYGAGISFFACVVHSRLRKGAR